MRGGACGSGGLRSVDVRVTLLRGRSPDKREENIEKMMKPDGNASGEGA